jgi:RHS repeat-associated protein
LQVTTGTGTHNIYPAPDGHTTDFYRPEILQSQEYSCYGVELSGWTFTSAEKYRYSFEDQEKDKEFWGGAVSYKYRVEDPRLGRFFSVDPLAPSYPEESPYHFAGNNPVYNIDVEGLEAGGNIYGAPLRNVNQMRGDRGVNWNFTQQDGFQAYDWGHYYNLYAGPSVMAGTAMLNTGDNIGKVIGGDRGDEHMVFYCPNCVGVSGAKGTYVWQKPLTTRSVVNNTVANTVNGAWLNTLAVTNTGVFGSAGIISQPFVSGTANPTAGLVNATRNALAGLAVPVLPPAPIVIGAPTVVNNPPAAGPINPLPPNPLNVGTIQVTTQNTTSTQIEQQVVQNNVIVVSFNTTSGPGFAPILQQRFNRLLGTLPPGSNVVYNPGANRYGQTLVSMGGFNNQAVLTPGVTNTTQQRNRTTNTVNTTTTTVVTGF